jgi:integrase
LGDPTLRRAAAGRAATLRVADIDLASGVIRVERGWDREEGAIELKSNAGRRRVPTVGALRDHLLDQLARSGRQGAELIFGRTASDPFAANRLQRHADEAWKEAKLNRITPHECRHSFAAMMIAAGVNAKTLQTSMGHSSITVTLDTYGHLMPGSEAEAAALVEAYLTANRSAPRRQRVQRSLPAFGRSGRSHSLPQPHHHDPWGQWVR